MDFGDDRSNLPAPSGDSDAGDVVGVGDVLGADDPQAAAGAHRQWSGMAPAYARGLADVYAGAISPILDTVALRVPLAGAQLVDVGCGTGRLSAAALARVRGSSPSTRPNPCAS